MRQAWSRWRCSTWVEKLELFRSLVGEGVSSCDAWEVQGLVCYSGRQVFTLTDETPYISPDLGKNDGSSLNANRSFHRRPSSVGSAIGSGGANGTTHIRPTQITPENWTVFGPKTFKNDRRRKVQEELNPPRCIIPRAGTPLLLK